MSSSQRPPKILVVDDGSESHDMAELIFHGAGGPKPEPEVLHAWNGRQGLELLRQHQDCDVLVLDLKMPEMDGFAVMEALGADRRFQGIPVMVFTADRHEANRALKAGARDFVTKPGDYVEIYLRILNLVDSKRRSEAAERAKLDFLSMVSHELRTPMNGVLGMAQALRDEVKHEAALSLLDVLEESSLRMVSMVNNLLGFLESENPLHSVPRVSFSLRAIVEAVVAEAQVQATRRGVTIETVVESTVPDALEGLPDRLQTILGHLMSNAVKFAPGGRAELSVVREPADGQTLPLTFRVSDTGEGFPEGWSRRSFDPFVQGDSGDTRQFGGMGLGLAVASRLVHLLGGELQIRSEAGGPTVVQFTLGFSLPR